MLLLALLVTGVGFKLISPATLRINLQYDLKLFKRMLDRALLDNCFRIIAIFINCNAFKIINYRNSLVSGLLKMGIWTINSRRKLPPPPLLRLGLGFGSRLLLVLGLGATRQLPSMKIDPWSGLEVRLWSVLGLGALFFGGNCFYVHLFTCLS